MSSIKYKNGHPFIEVNGELISPVAMRSFRPQPYNIAQFSRMGVRLFQMIVSGKKNALDDMYSLYGGVWTGENEYDFTGFDKQMEMFMKFAPDGYFLVMIQLDTPDWYVEKNKNAYDSFKNLGIAVVDEKWKKEAADFLKSFITYAEEKYGDRIFGYSYSCGLCTEWFMNDKGLATEEKEKAYKKYLNDENARIPVLGGDEYLDECDLRNPCSNEKKYMDFCCKLSAELVCYFAKEAQSILNHQKLVGVFYGYIDQGTSIKQNLWFTNFYETVWKSSDIDMLFSPASYNDNRFFEGVPLFQYAIDSLPFNNKLYIHEIDHRTELAMYPLSTGNFMWDCYETYEESVAVLRREFCNLLVKNSGFWWFDFYGGYFSTPQYERELKNQLEIYKLLNSTPFKQVADVAVFVDAQSMNYMKERVNLVPECVRANLTELVKSGAMIKTFNINDITKIDVNEFKLFVFLNSLKISDEIHSFIKNNLSDKYKFFVYAPNIMGDEMDSSRIENITGIKVKEFAKKEKHTAIYDGVEFGFDEAVSPLFYVDDANSDDIALYENGYVCIAQKDKTFYCAMGNIPYTLWQYAQKKSGAHIWAYNGCYVAATDKFVAHQNTKSTKCEITLPFECELEEIFDGGLYKTKNKKLCYKAKIGETKLFKIKAI